MSRSRTTPRDPTAVEDCRSVVLSLCNDGFLLAKNHGINHRILDRLDESVERIMALPDEALRVYIDPDGKYQRGYGPYGSEGAVDSDVYDLKRFWMNRDPTKPLNPANWRYGPNIFPREVPESEELSNLYLAQALSVANRILGCFEVFLGYEPGLLTRLIYGSETTHRAIYYPPIENFGELAKRALRSAPHTDINARTILPYRRGVQVRRGDVWGDIEIPKGEDVILVNDGMQLPALGFLRNDLARHGLAAEPTWHRVVNDGDPTKPRFAHPVFVHLLGDVVFDEKTGLQEHEWLDEVIAGLTRKRE